MSGSSSDFGFGGGGGYSGGSGMSCKDLSIKTQLASPKPPVIATLRVGELLDVELTPPVGPVQAKKRNGEVAGAILSPNVAQLIECISGGSEYQAKVLEISGGNCQVLITHV